MKRLAAAAFVALLAIPAAQAQPYQRHPNNRPTHVQPRPPIHHPGRDVVKPFDPPGRHVVRPRPDRHVWRRGQRVHDWRRYQGVDDYRRYGLRRPGPGQRWVRIDDRYVLISIATGIILGLGAGY